MNEIIFHWIWASSKIENFELDHLSISRQMNFLSLSLSLEMNFWVLAATFWVFQVLLSSRFSKLQTIKPEFQRVWNLSYKTCRVFEFGLARSSTRKMWICSKKLDFTEFMNKRRFFLFPKLWIWIWYSQLCHNSHKIPLGSCREANFGMCPRPVEKCK